MMTIVLSSVDVKSKVILPIFNPYQKSGEGNEPQLPCLIWGEKTPKSQNTGELPGNYLGIPRLPIFEIKKKLSSPGSLQPRLGGKGNRMVGST